VPVALRIAIRPLTPADRDLAVIVINLAARWYREFLPPDELHDPEITAAQWNAEAQRMTWYGAFVHGRLVGVMALEPVHGHTALLRHAYVVPDYQRQGVGSGLQDHLEAEARAQSVRRLIVGTYAGNYKARAALEKAGYRLSADPDSVLRAYYAIPDDRRRSSVSYEKTIG
jgi:GNAT superfamily N-acetyltransferase